MAFSLPPIWVQYTSAGFAMPIGFTCGGGGASLDFTEHPCNIVIPASRESINVFSFSSLYKNERRSAPRS
ncbi:hypothetical protein AK51_18145 [Serratia nematodiphila DZ0503SBS1]|nr:hypothetical protein AK51_18145 [Serratia nematodiphila DZ0503SBS1]